MSVIEMINAIKKGEGQYKQKADKVTLIDAQIRFVREMDGSIEHITWFLNVDQLMDFEQKHCNKSR